MTQNQEEREAQHDGDELSAAMHDARDGEPPAQELRRMALLLRERQTRLGQDLQTESDERERTRIQREIEKLNESIRVLREEADITGFVEDAVRVGVEMRKLENY